MLLQRAACGVMLAQAWRYGNELLGRGDAESFFLAAAGLLLGLLLAFSTYQAASRSSLWISCMLSGGLVGLGHLRSVGGRTSEDAVIVTAFMFSCVLGCALPQVMWHACLSHGSEALMTFVLAVLVTEAVSSWETMPLDLSKVLISIFLLTTGFYGLFHGTGAFRKPSHVTYETPISEPRVEERGGEKPEKRGGERPGKDYTAFFPASVVESRKYSPHFLLGHRARLRRGSSAGVPSGSPLLELQPRQAETAGPSRKAGKAADNKRREKISNRTPVPFEPQETRPKVPDMDEQDANEENDASALLKGDPIEAVLSEGHDVTVEDHDEDVAATAESVETSKKDPEVLPLQTMDVATPETLEALPLAREFEAPKNLNVLAAEFVPPEVTLTQTALGFDAPSSDSYDMQVESTGATGYDMSYGEVQGGIGSMASYNALEGADFTGFDVPNFDGGFDGSMDQPFMETDVGYGAANGSFAEYQSWGNGTSQGPFMPQVYGEAASWSDSFETYDGYAYGSEAYDSYGYPVEEPGWNETAWDETAPYAGDGGHLNEVSQPRRRSWENPTLIEDKEDSDGAWGPVAAPLAQLPDPGLGRASVARKNNEKGRGKERKGHSISATSMGKNGPFTGTSSEPKGGKGEKGKKGGRGKGKEASETQGDALWAYVDPRGKIQSGFSSAKMRSWFESGYFKEHLEVAQVKDGQVPPRRAFQPLSQLFGSAERCFL